MEFYMKNSLKYFNFLLVTFFLVCSSTAGFALTLRTASQSGSEPKYIKVGGKAEGLEVEIIRAVQKADPGIKIVGLDKWLPFKRIKDQMEKGNLDCFFGFSYNEERAKTFWYIQPPLYKLEYNMLMRAEDSFEPKSFDHIRSLGKDGKILTLFGTAGFKILKKQGGLEIVEGAKSSPSLIKMLNSKRGRFLFYQSFGTVHNVKKMGMEKKFKLSKVSFNNSGHYLAFPKATVSEAVVKRLAAALNKIRANGEMDRIIKKYTTVQ